MDIDENDIFFTNSYMNMPELPKTDNISDDVKDEFINYYKKQTESIENDRINKNSILREDIINQDEDLLNVYDFDKNKKKENITNVRKTQDIQTLINVDSRDRDMVNYPKPNNFKISLGKVFYNIKTIKLVSIEFPNTNAVINSTNNNIYWINKEDIDDDIVDNITKTYPVYSVKLRTGSYIASTLQSEIVSKMSTVKRKNKTGDYHYFDVNLDLDTDVVSFTSLVLTQLPNNPLSASVGTGIITVSAPSHGFSTGNIVYIVGAKSFAGIQSSVLNTSQEIVVINSNSFQFEINVKAGETSVGGGNTVKTGKEAPFQFLFGQYSNTISKNLGFPLENSSQRVNVFIKSIVNIYQVKIVTETAHNFVNSYDFINQVCVINSSGTTPDIDGNRVITTVLDSKTFLISVNTPISFSVFNSGNITFNTYTSNILSISNYDTDTVLLTTFTKHNYTPQDINNSIEIDGSISIPNLDGINTIYSVISPTSMIIPGHLLDGGDYDVSVINDGGNLSCHNALTSNLKIITGVSVGATTTFICVNHGLVAGQRIKLYNLKTSPSILDFNSGIHKVMFVNNSSSFTIDFMTNSYEIENVLSGDVYITTSILDIYFPYHGFNTIVSINSIVDISFNVEVNTLLPHGLSTGDIIRIMETDISIDESYEIEVVDLDTFKIFVPGGIVSTGTKGILGMSNNFYMYGAKTFAGIDENSLNNIKFNVYEIIDEHNFRFDCDVFPTKYEIGGGDNIYISSFKHGFQPTQNNTKNDNLNHSITLEGENYSFLCSPQLGNLRNTGDVTDIFARITLDQSPGAMVFNFLSSPKTYETPLHNLSEIEFFVKNYDNTLYEFFLVDFSFVLEITENLDTTDVFNISSRRNLPATFEK